MKARRLTAAARYIMLAAAVIVAALSLDLAPAMADDDGRYYVSGDYCYTLSDGEAKIAGYAGSASELKIPSQLDGHPVTTISRGAFSGNESLQSIAIPEGVAEIGDWAFSSCSALRTVSIPSSVTEIGSAAFFECRSLQSVSLQEGLESISGSAFAYCTSLQSVSMPQSVTSLGGQIFNGCTALQTVSISQNATTIRAETFAGCTSLRSANIPASVTTIMKDAFKGCASLTIYGNQRSYAQQYAQEEGIPFVATDGGSSGDDTPAAPTSFADVPSGEWYTDWVTKAAQRKLMTGYKEGSTYTGYFGPEDTVTRAQVATVLWRIAGEPSTSATALWDARGHWAETAIAWCQEKGIITGYTDGQYKGMFRPDADVTREEFAAMAYRFAKWAGVNVTGASTSAFNKCADTNLVGWSKSYMVWCAAAGVITGKDYGGTYYLAPQETATRAQAAKILVQIAKMAGGEISPYSLDDDGETTDGATAQSEDTAATEEVTYDEVTFDDMTTVGTATTADGTGAAKIEGAADTTGAGKTDGSEGETTGGKVDDAADAGTTADQIDGTTGGDVADEAAKPDDTTDATSDAGITGSADSFDAASPAEPTAGDEGESSSFSEPVTIELAGAAAGDLAA